MGCSWWWGRRKGKGTFTLFDSLMEHKCGFTIAKFPLARAFWRGERKASCFQGRKES
jgi:hypothetical protein